MLRKATAKDIDWIEQSYTDLLTYEKEHGSNTNWVLDLYPVRATAEKALAAGTLYVWEEEGQLKASMNVNQDQAEEYAQIPWQYAAEPAEVLVIHTLCIPPQGAGRGTGKAMVKAAMGLGRERGCKVIRLDTWEGNKPAAGLYTSLGFRYAGGAHIMLQGVIPEEQVFFEYKL